MGEQKVSHSRLSEFRVGHRSALEKLFTDVLGVLLSKRLVTLDLVAQDGTRVRASASPRADRDAPVDAWRARLVTEQA